MKKLARRIRGAIGMGLTWATAWFLVGMVMLFIVGFGAADVPFPLFFGFLGFLAGVTFSGILGVVERRHKFEQMSLRRFAVWGGVGGLLLAGGLGLVAGLGADLLVVGPIFALSGAVCAAGSLALARKAQDRRALDHHAGLVDPELPEAGTQDLLGR